MDNGRMKFFIKFNLTEKYADSLIEKGEIYTNCPRFYIYLNDYKNVKGIGDNNEGTILGIIRKDSLLPMYCMYGVKENDIINHNGKSYIRINKKAIDVFTTFNNTSFVIINPKRFIFAVEELRNLKKIDLRLDEICYTSLSIEQQINMITDKTARVLTTKTQEFAYQQEVRLIINDPFEQLHVDRKYDLVYFKDNKFRKYEGRKYYLGNMREYALKFNKDDLLNISESYYGLDINLINEII